MSSLPLYALRKREVFESLETSADGLTCAEVESRRLLYGANLLVESPPPPAWRKLVHEAGHPMALLLWTASAAALLIGRGELSFVICCVILINAGFSHWRESRAGKAVSTLRCLLPAYARVIRNGQETRLPASEIVPGDILTLAAGDNIPADARLVEVYGLRTNNTTLTGESLPAVKTAEASVREDLSEIERPNLVFAGTSVISGTGRAVVFATGMLTQFGRIANLTQNLAEENSQIQIQMMKISRTLSLAGLGIGFVVFFVGISEVGFSPTEAFILAIGICVAIIPEGLVPTVTLTLAIAVQRLAQQGVLVKRLSVVETLGATSVVCTDKSGTLTQNQMTVRRLWTAGGQFTISGVGYEPVGEISPYGTNKQDLTALCTAAMLCNNSRLISPTPDHPKWTALGDQTEAALHVLALKFGLDETDITQIYPRFHELPFDAHRKRMSTLHRQENRTLAFVKGAPREVLQLCTSVQLQGQTLPLDAETRAAIIAANDEFSCSALRVLALARRELSPRAGSYTQEDVEQNLTFLGLAGMMDPPRSDVAQAVEASRSAGIRMVMITGDYGLTAEAVARRVGMLSSATPRIVTGADLETMNDETLQSLLEEEVIYSRMAPEHKLRLVGALQIHGDVVAMIGDGVNDTPSLRKADIGIAMGITGTDVAKEAADVILMGDDFSSVVHAIEEGRAVYDNLRKFITYILASNVPEVLPFIITALFNIPLALTVAQILAIDLGTDLLPSLALGAEKPEPGVMQRPPRRRNQPLVDHGLLLRSFFWLGAIEATLCYLAFFWLSSWSGPVMIYLNYSAPWRFFPVENSYLLATTGFHVGVVMAQIGNAFACRTETASARRLGWTTNPYLLGGIAFELILIIAIVNIPPFAKVFGHIPLPPIAWLGLGIFALMLYGLEQGRKVIVRHINHKKGLIKGVIL